MEHYVTLFDSLFLPQGLALHMSMERHMQNYSLWVLCVDDQAHEVLTKLNLPNIRLLQLSKLETAELQSVKKTRSKGEYCWTLTPFAPRFVFEADLEVKRVTYLDADLWFLRSPSLIFEEFDKSRKQVLITDHAYAPEYDKTSSSGQYCVQFMIFNRKGSEIVRKWWEERCIDWCFARVENGKFGDQRYLDDWPERFVDFVHVLNSNELALAPWNAVRFPFATAVFYHFHGLRIVSDNKINIGLYHIPKSIVQSVYVPYLVDLRIATQVLLSQVKFKFSAQTKKVSLLKIIYNPMRLFFLGFRVNFNTGQMKW